MELTTGKYDNSTYNPSPVILQLAREPAQPILPRQVQHRAAPKTRRERVPLQSSLTGPGRAGSETTLLGSHGSKYTGQVLAGRPHGVGQYWASTQGQALQLVYEGEFVRGVRHGQGTAYYSSRGEVYSGQWVDGRRTGPGKLSYADGCVYEGMWSQDVRQGVGTLYSPSGSIFLGTYVQDKRQGLGVTYWGTRSKKYVAEYMDDTPVCGAYTDLTDDSAEAPATQQLRDAMAAARLKAAAAAAGSDCVGEGLEMPDLQVIQPSQVLAREFGAVRHCHEKQQQDQQGTTPAALAAATEPGTGTLAANTITLLRHAFILIAGGDDLAAHVLPHQLQELVVLAGLDPVSPAVLKLLGLLHSRIKQVAGSKLFLDDLLDVAAFYREQPLAERLLQQSQAASGAAADASAGDAAAAAGGDGQEQLCSEQVEDAAEVWQEESIEQQAACDVEGSEADMLAYHIAQHRPAAPVPEQVECM